MTDSIEEQLEAIDDTLALERVNEIAGLTVANEALTVTNEALTVANEALKKLNDQQSELLKEAVVRQDDFEGMLKEALESGAALDQKVRELEKALAERTPPAAPLQGIEEGSEVTMDIVVKTLVQDLITREKSHAADRELAEILENGYKVLNISVLNATGLASKITRVVTLRRIGFEVPTQLLMKEHSVDPSAPIDEKPDDAGIIPLVSAIAVDVVEDEPTLAEIRIMGIDEELPADLLVFPDGMDLDKVTYDDVYKNPEIGWEERSHVIDLEAARAGRAKKQAFFDMQAAGTTT